MFNINMSSETARQLKSGAIRPDQLILQKTSTHKGRQWELKTASEVAAGDVAIQILARAEGADVEKILRQVANNEALPAEFAELGKNQKFRRFTRIIPGIETARHEAVMGRVNEKVARVKKVLTTMVKGTGQLKSQNKPSRILDSGYVLREILMKDLAIPIGGSRIGAAEKLESCWKNSNTPLDYGSWLESLKEEHQGSPGYEDFLPWFAANEWNKQEKGAWESAHPGEVFSEEKFTEWKRTQYPPESFLPEPQWLLKQQWEQSNAQLKLRNIPEVSFDAYVVQRTAETKNQWKSQLGAVDDATLKMYAQKWFDYSNKYEMTLPWDIWIEKETWKQDTFEDPTDENFITYMEYQQCRREYQPQVSEIQPKIDECNARMIELTNRLERQKSLPSREPVKENELSEQIQACAARLSELQNALQIPPPSDFANWKSRKDQELRQRWTATHTSLPFDEWKSQQIFNPLIPVPFVSLNAEQRKGYETQCTGGRLMRADAPFATTQESTVHSGKGWAIFVIGPGTASGEIALYCGSHITGVFHHSSFLGDAAVMAGGEVKTDASGKIIELSAKSGHYRPSHRENVEMLSRFESQGVVLQDITFTYYLPNWQPQRINAKEYLNMVKTSAQEGTRLFQEGKYQEASTRLTIAAEIDPQNILVKQSLGNAYAFSGQPDKAIAVFQEILARDPRNKDAETQLGHSYYSTGRFAEAITHYTKVAALDPQSILFKEFLGNAHVANREPDKAIAVFQEILRLDPRNKNAEIQLGYIYYGKGQFAEAITHYTKAVALDPQNSWAKEHLSNVHGAIAKAYFDKENYEDAIEHLKEALKNNPGNVELQEAFTKVLAHVAQAPSPPPAAAAAPAQPIAGVQAVAQPAAVVQPPQPPSGPATAI